MDIVAEIHLTPQNELNEFCSHFLLSCGKALSPSMLSKILRKVICCGASKCRAEAGELRVTCLLQMSFSLIASRVSQGDRQCLPVFLCSRIVMKGKHIPKRLLLPMEDNTMERKEEDKTHRYMLPGFMALMGKKRPPERFILLSLFSSCSCILIQGPGIWQRKILFPLTVFSSLESKEILLLGIKHRELRGGPSRSQLLDYS